MQSANKPQVDPKQVRKSLLTWVVVAAVIIIVFQIGFGTVWREGVIRPLLNALIFFYAYLGRNFIVAIAAFTITLRLLTFPLQIKQIRSSKLMSALQPKVKELQEKYSNDKERLVAEQQRLYKEHGVNPLSGCLPTLVQLPIWFGLYQAINSLLADTPMGLMSLGQNVYSGFAAVVDIIPVQSYFLGINLAQPDPTSIVLPVLVAGTTWLQQKMMTQPSADAQQASMNQTMQLMMPLMFGYFTTQFSSGLAIYFVISNLVGIIMQWSVERMEGPRIAAIVQDQPTGKKRREKTSNGSSKRTTKA